MLIGVLPVCEVVLEFVVDVISVCVLGVGVALLVLGDGVVVRELVVKVGVYRPVSVDGAAFLVVVLSNFWLFLIAVWAVLVRVVTCVVLLVVVGVLI